MQLALYLAVFLLAAWCFIEAGISLWIIKSWDEPYHDPQINEYIQQMPARSRRSLKLMHVRHAVGWTLAGGFATWFAIWSY